MLPIIKQRKLWFTISSLLVVASVGLLLGWGLRFGIDFTGGSLLELNFSETVPTANQVTDSLNEFDLGTITAQPAGESGMVIKFNDIDESMHQQVLMQLEQDFATETNTLTEQRFESIGPSIGNELRDKTIWAMGIVLVAIILYIAWAFRKVSKPVASWKYGCIAVIALFHDVLITLGVFSVLGYLYGIEINAPFVAALLTILGYSVNDTIVVFDRTRENLIKRVGDDFEDIVQDSVNQTLTRSINSSVTTLLVLFAILLFGGSTIRDFVLALIIGIGIGTYSSIFLASPLLVTWHKKAAK